MTRSPVDLTARLWAKLGRDESGLIVAWHSLPDHSADVAAVVEVLLLQPVLADRMARLAGRSELDPVTRARLGALAFLHDVGKANRGFRGRTDPKAKPVGHIDQLAWLFFGGRFAEPSRDRLFDVLGLDRVLDWCGEGWEGLIPSVFAHHGRPWNAESPPPSEAYWKAGPDMDPIGDLAVMREKLDLWFPVAFSAGPPLPAAPLFHHAFAGLLMLADWLGSDASDDAFPFANGLCPDRMAFARRRAGEVVRRVGLAGEASRAAARQHRAGFRAIFGGHAPRPLQKAAAESGSNLVVLEAETGSGKTEAALWRFAELFRAGQADGLYFALPTRVAATQIFERVKRFRDGVFPADERPVVVLAVPGQLRVDDVEGRLLPGFEAQWADTPQDSGKVLARWAAEHPKRFLAAPIAVGTVDQALLGALRVRHAHLRGTALLRHLLVVDEVHASDRYMEELLAELLHSHLAAGGHALLLSATLGAGMRARLLGASVPTLAEAEAVPYPALTDATSGRERHRRIAASGREKAVRIRPLPNLADPAAIAVAALDAARRGAKVLVVRNTVTAAIRTAQALEAACGADSPLLFRVPHEAGGTVVTLHHSRFAEPDRRRLDRAVEEAIGRDRREGGLVVIGTQTLEQSLDLDADLLLTDLCPVDVLLQRVGRLHRHERVRPPGFDAAEAHVLVPAGRNLLAKGLLAFGLGMGPSGGVYEDLRIVEATWRLIEGGSDWSIPRDSRRLVEAATHPERLRAVEEELAASDGRWQAHFNTGEGRLFADLYAASHARLDRTEAFDRFRIETDERLATRLGARDRHVDFEDAERPPPPVGPFGLPVRALRLPDHMARRISEDAVPAEVVDKPGGFSFRLGETVFTYDRFGARRE